MNIPLIIIGVIEQIIVFTIVLPSTGWWFAIFGFAAAWEIFSNIGNIGSSSTSDKDYYHEADYDNDDDYTETSEDEVFRTRSVSDSDSYDTNDYDNTEASTVIDEVNIVSKPVDPSRVIPKKGNDDLLKQGFKVVKKSKSEE